MGLVIVVLNSLAGPVLNTVLPIRMLGGAPHVDVDEVEATPSPSPRSSARAFLNVLLSALEARRPGATLENLALIAVLERLFELQQQNSRDFNNICFILAELARDPSPRTSELVRGLVASLAQGHPRPSQGHPRPSTPGAFAALNANPTLASEESGPVINGH